MESQASENCERLRGAFEGREALYIEKGVCRVRVTNIRCNVAGRSIRAEVERVPSNLAGGIFYGEPRSQPWRIRAGFLPTFSATDGTWAMVAGHCSLQRKF